MRFKLVSLVGASAAAVLFSQVPTFEGVILRGYQDPIGIVTACAGHTKTAVLGKPYTPAECERLLVEDLAEHAKGVLTCTPSLEGNTGPLAAATSFAFNVGVARYCSSTMARKIKAGDIMGACAELPRWVYADGKKLNGLIKRREIERQICEGTTDGRTAA